MPLENLNQNYMSRPVITASARVVAPRVVKNISKYIKYTFGLETESRRVLIIRCHHTPLILQSLPNLCRHNTPRIYPNSNSKSRLATVLSATIDKYYQKMLTR